MWNRKGRMHEIAYCDIVLFAAITNERKKRERRALSYCWMRLFSKKRKKNGLVHCVISFVRKNSAADAAEVETSNKQDEKKNIILLGGAVRNAKENNAVAFCARGKNGLAEDI